MTPTRRHDIDALCVLLFATLIWIAAVLGWSATLLDRPFRWLPYATEAILPWYMLHQSLIIMAAFVLVPLKIGAMPKVLAVLVFTIGGCALLHELVIRRGSDGSG